MCHNRKTPLHWGLLPQNMIPLSPARNPVRHALSAQATFHRQQLQHYEKQTRWMIKTMPAQASIVIKIDKNQKIKKIIKTDSY